MPTHVRIALAQINITVGDLEGNSKKILDLIAKAEQAKAEIVLFPELAITGYPPEDLVLKRKFVADSLLCLESVAKQNTRLIAIVGYVGERAQRLYNCAALLSQGKISAVYQKIQLPNYSVFDEMRYFTPGKHPMIFEYNGIKFGLNICEDIWVPDDVAECQAFRGGAEIILSLSASPYYLNKRNDRLAMLKARARRTRTHIAYLNLIGGQDELIFDGNSFVVDYRGEIIAEARQFREDFTVVDLEVDKLRQFRNDDPVYFSDKINFRSQRDVKFVMLPSRETHEKPTAPPKASQPLPKWEEIFQALILGTKDYVSKNGFQKVVIGLSGGIDSALTAVIAAEALGAQNVIGVLMPSEFTTERSITDAQALADNLGLETYTVPIQKSFECYRSSLKPIFGDRPEDVTEENLQARIRGNILMALSNKYGWLVLTTGNKSETSVGYCTLYGDMAGGFAVIKDVPKTWVYHLSRHINERAGKAIIPDSVLTKAPTAELRPGQKDQDSLPPYELLDAILEEFVEKDKSVREIIDQGYPRDVVKKVARLVDINEYKRRQAPPGIKITAKAFGKDRRMPITNRYKT